MGSSPILIPKTNNMKVKIQNFCFALTSLGIISSLLGIALFGKELASLYQIGMIMGFGLGLTSVGFILRLISNKF